MPLELRSAVILALSAFSVVPAHAWQTAPNRLITLDVAVTEKSGTALPGLQQQDFTLLDNKQPQKIVSFQPPASGPVQVIVVIDEVNASFRAVSTERIQIEKYLNENGGHLANPTSLVFFTDKGASIGGEPTQDGHNLLSMLKDTNSPLRTIGRNQGFYGASDRVQLSLNTVNEIAAYESPKPGRKLVIWISPGWPLLSGPREDLTSKAQEGLFNTIVGLSDSLRKAQITLFSIDPLGTADAGGLRTIYYESFLKGVKSPNQVQIGNLGLQVLARQSGGLALNSSNDVAGEVAECANDAKSNYVLTFEAQPGDGPNDYHSLEVKVDRPKVMVRTRTGYYAQPDQASTH